MSIDPYAILEIQRGFTLEELKDQYKKKVYHHHPDKNPNIASTPLFQILTAAYKMLIVEYNQRSSDKQFHELKSTFETEKHGSNRMNTELLSARPIMAAGINMNGRDFNIERFNDVFGKTRIEDVYTSSGYKQWLTKEDISDEKDRTLIRYKEPVSASGSSAAHFFELGKDSIADWSGDNTNKKDLHFMDCRVAYTTSKLVDENTVKKKKDYKSVEELEKDRSSIAYVMSEKDMRAVEKKKLKEARNEKKRLESLANYDQQIQEKHMIGNKLLLG